MTSFLLLTPFFLAVSVALASLAMALENINLAKSACREAIVQSQLELAKVLHRLEGLNPKAKHLRKVRKLAESNLKIALASLQPELIAAARAHLASIVSQQAALASEQQLLLGRADQIRAASRSRVLSLASPASLGHVQFYARSIRALAVQPVPPESLTPDYVAVSNFSKYQQFGFSWQIDLLERLPREIRQQIKQTTLIRDRCDATLKRENHLWQPTLIAAKY